MSTHGSCKSLWKRHSRASSIVRAEHSPLNDRISSGPPSTPWRGDLSASAQPNAQRRLHCGGDAGCCDEAAQTSTMVTTLHFHCRLAKPNVVADTGDAPLRYTARSTGNCLDFSFPRQPRTTQTPSASPGAPPMQAPKR